MKNIGKIFLFSLTLIWMNSCSGDQVKKSKEAEIQELIDARVAEKIDVFREKHLKKCRDRVLNKASELADSIIMAKAISTPIIDNTERPPPPPRPPRPPIKPAIDTTPVTPLFEVDTID